MTNNTNGTNNGAANVTNAGAGNASGNTAGNTASKLLPGAILIGLGLLALFGNLGLNIAGNLVMGLLLGGLAFYVYRQGVQTNKASMKLLALPLAGLAVLTVLPGRSTGALFLALIGLAFVAVWRSDLSRWWAVIPAGTFASLAATAGLSRLPGNITGFIFLFGLAATFYALTRLNVNPQPWAIYPAGALAVISALALFNGGGTWLFPIVLLAAGAVLLARSGVEGLGWLAAMLPASWRVNPQGEAAAEVSPFEPGGSEPALVTTEPVAVQSVGQHVEQPIEPAASGDRDDPATISPEN